ncbi:hypothetical protein I4U23_020717 [Adineta vaga]|nr:hypothetical protein I4U23_020717 [Adineta vaga]
MPMDEQFDFRALLVKLQDCLSDNDRRRLHFIVGDTIPRQLRDDPTLGGTLNLLETLFDQAKISEQDFNYLIQVFREIHCHEGVKRLKEYQLIRNGHISRTKMTISEIVDDNETDRVAIKIVVFVVLRRNSCIHKDETSERFFILREGLFYGEPLGGDPFDDAATKSLTINDKLIGVKASWSFDSLTAITFTYSNGATATHGTGDGTRSSVFTSEMSLNSKESFTGVTIYKGVRDILNPYQPNGTTIIVGLQFYKTSNKIGELLGSANGTRYDEILSNYKLAFAKGRSHGYIDALQFVWSKFRHHSKTGPISKILN